MGLTSRRVTPWRGEVRGEIHESPINSEAAVWDLLSCYRYSQARMKLSWVTLRELNGNVCLCVNPQLRVDLWDCGTSASASGTCMFHVRINLFVKRAKKRFFGETATSSRETCASHLGLDFNASTDEVQGCVRACVMTKIRHEIDGLILIILQPCLFGCL